MLKLERLTEKIPELSPDICIREFEKSAKILRIMSYTLERIASLVGAHLWGDEAVERSGGS